jgi:hypothetical protein
VPSSIVPLMLLAAGLLIVGIANASLFAWSRGQEGRFPVDRGDPDDVRLAKVGVDTTFGTLPILIAMFMQAFSIDAPLELSPATVVIAIAFIFAYLLVYFWVVRPKYGAFRLRIRRLLRSSGREG